MKLTINLKDKQYSMIVDDNDTVQILKKQIEIETKIPYHQQELSCKSNDKKVILSDDQAPLKLAKIPSNNELSLKNLGKQIRWDYVFYIEYFGPLFIFPIFYLIGNKEQYTDIQCWALIMALIHYTKRQYETAFVHVFSRYTMPFQRVFINCIHYWVFFALFNAVELYMFPSGHTYPSWLIYLLVAVWTVFEFCNYKCHMILSSFRRNKEKTDRQENVSKKREIPYGWGFDIVSCANYFWEALGWIAFSILTRTWTSYFFTIASIYQMTVWALKKHKTYKEEFGERYPRGRKAIFPFIV